MRFRSAAWWCHAFPDLSQELHFLTYIFQQQETVDSSFRPSLFDGEPYWAGGAAEPGWEGSVWVQGTSVHSPPPQWPRWWGSLCVKTLCHAYNFVLLPSSKEKYPWKQRSSNRKESTNEQVIPLVPRSRGAAPRHLDTWASVRFQRWVRHSLGFSSNYLTTETSESLFPSFKNWKIL